MSTKERTSKIANLDCKKHIKIYALNKIGLSNKEVADALGTNTGHVCNVLKMYKAKPSLKKIADNIGTKGSVPKAQKKTAKAKAPVKAKAKAKVQPKSKAKAKAPTKAKAQPKKKATKKSEQPATEVTEAEVEVEVVEPISEDLVLAEVTDAPSEEEEEEDVRG